MIVYVETNFLIDFGVKQESFPVTERILELAEASKIDLALPALAFLEAIHTVEGWRTKRAQLATALRSETAQLRRSPPEAQRVAAFEATAGELIQLDGEQRTHLQAAARRVLSASRLLPINLGSLDLAIESQRALLLDPADSIVYSAIVTDLEAQDQETPKCFLSRDRRFDAAAQRELALLGCRFIQSFADGLAFIESLNE